MIAVIAEEASDCDFLRCMLRRLKNNEKLKVAQKALHGSGNVLREGAKHVRLMRAAGAKKFIVCVDSDGVGYEVRRKQIEERVFSPAKLSLAERHHSAAVVPVEMIEAWIFADASSLAGSVFENWHVADLKNAEAISDPKGKLQAASEGHNGKPKYVPAIHNGIIAKHLNIAKVSKCCPSFDAFVSFVKSKI